MGVYFTYNSKKSSIPHAERVVLSKSGGKGHSLTHTDMLWPEIIRLAVVCG